MAILDPLEPPLEGFTKYVIIYKLDEDDPDEAAYAANTVYYSAKPLDSTDYKTSFTPKIVPSMDTITDTKVKVYYRAGNSSGAPTIGLNWYVDEPVYQKYHTDRWSTHTGNTSSSIAINNLSWRVEFSDGDTRLYVHRAHRVRKHKSIRLSSPKTRTYNGVYSDYYRRYLTVNYGFDKEPQKFPLDSQVNYILTMKSWNYIDGLPLASPGVAGTPFDFEPYLGETNLEVIGIYDNIVHYPKTSCKNYTQFLQDVGVSTIREPESFRFNIQLASSNPTFRDSETLSVLARSFYEFNAWKTSSAPLSNTNRLRMSDCPSTSNVTIYADWTLANQVVDDYFPSWETGELMAYGSDPVRYVRLECFNKAYGNIYYSKDFGVYVSKQAKHVSWTDGTNTYDIGSSIPLKQDVTYLALWEPDETAVSVESIPENLISIPDPPPRSGFTYLGVAESDTDVLPAYQPGELIRIQTDLRLFGIWKANGAAKIYKDENNCKSYQVWIYSGSEWKLYIPKVFDGTDWKIVI